MEGLSPARGDEQALRAIAAFRAAAGRSFRATTTWKSIRPVHIGGLPEMCATIGFARDLPELGLEDEMTAKNALALLVAAITLSVVACSSPVAQPAPTTDSAGSEPASAADVASNGDMQIRFVNLAEGGSIAGTLDESGKPLVSVQFEVSGVPPASVDLSANGVQVPSLVVDSQEALPFAGVIKWSPWNGGGDYEVTLTAVSSEKDIATATVHVTVTGIPAIARRAMDRTTARTRMTELFDEIYGIDVPAPSMHRYDSAERPDLSRWIGAVYYRNGFYYLDLFDDGHYVESGGNYAGVAIGDPVRDALCRPSGDFRILVAFVDYGNISFDHEAAIADVPRVAEWMNQLYDGFALNEGFDSALMHLNAQGVYLTVPTRGELLTAEEVRAATGVDTREFDFLFEVDVDADNTVGTTNFEGVLAQGGGIALHGCGKSEYDVNVFSVARDETDIHGVLVMDFNHELSHLLGMRDSYPYVKVTLPDGLIIDDWIPYELLGWSDADGDGVPEIIDPTPYGTNGPKP